MTNALKLKFTNLLLSKQNYGLSEGALILSDDKAIALAKLLSKLTWSDVRVCADSDTEADIMSDVVTDLRFALAKAHYAYPRHPVVINYYARKKTLIHRMN
jgi:hypothetical protein